MAEVRCRIPANVWPPWIACISLLYVHTVSASEGNVEGKPLVANESLNLTSGHVLSIVVLSVIIILIVFLCATQDKRNSGTNENDKSHDRTQSLSKEVDFPIPHNNTKAANSDNLYNYPVVEDLQEVHDYDYVGLDKAATENSEGDHVPYGDAPHPYYNFERFQDQFDGENSHFQDRPVEIQGMPRVTAPSPYYNVNSYVNDPVGMHTGEPLAQPGSVGHLKGLSKNDHGANENVASYYNVNNSGDAQCSTAGKKKASNGMKLVYGPVSIDGSTPTHQYYNVNAFLNDAAHEVAEDKFAEAGSVVAMKALFQTQNEADESSRKQTKSDILTGKLDVSGGKKSKEGPKKLKTKGRAKKYEANKKKNQTKVTDPLYKEHTPENKYTGDGTGGKVKELIANVNQKGSSADQSVNTKDIKGLEQTSNPKRLYNAKDPRGKTGRDGLRKKSQGSGANAGRKWSFEDRPVSVSVSQDTTRRASAPNVKTEKEQKLYVAPGSVARLTEVYQGT